jgi:hypothetical protein
VSVREKGVRVLMTPEASCIVVPSTTMNQMALGGRCEMHMGELMAFYWRAVDYGQVLVSHGHMIVTVSTD